MKFRSYRAFAAIAGVALTVAVPGAAQISEATQASDGLTTAAPDLISTDRFANGSAFDAPQVSPDGSKIGLLTEVNGTTQLIILDAATRELKDRLFLSDDLYIRWFEWAGSNKVLISFSTKVSQDPADRLTSSNFPFTRLLFRDLATGEGKVLKVARKTRYGDRILHIADDGSSVLLSVSEGWWGLPKVVRHQLKPEGEVETVQIKRRGVRDWFADDEGVVRLGIGWRRGINVVYRPDGKSNFRTVARFRPGDTKRAWTVASIIEGSDTGYILEEGEDGKVAVVRVNYTTGEVVDTFYEHPDWDVETLWLVEGKPFAALYTDDVQRITWFNSDFAALEEDLNKALPGQRIRFGSRSRDNKRMVIWAGNEGDPGAYYVYSAATRSLDLLGEVRPGLDFRSLTKPRPVSYTARDGLSIRAYLTVPPGREEKNLPLIIMPHGGPFGVRDELRYNDEVQLLANRGYAVLQPNFRGSGGYGDQFYDAGEGEVGRKMQDDLDDAMDWAVQQGIADSDRVCVVGGSYGGYAAMWAVLRNPERYRCAASWAGVTDWPRALKRDRRLLTRSDRREWRIRFEGEEKFDLDDVSPVTFADRLSRPVLLAHGTDDRTVPFDQYELMVEAASEAPVPLTTLVIEGEGHSFSSAKNEQAWYNALDKFLAEHNPADQVDSDGKLKAGANSPAGVSAVPIDLPPGAGGK